MSNEFLLTSLVMGVGFVVTLLITIPLERRRLRRAEERFLRGRVALPDDSFLVRAGTTAAEATFFLATRRAMAYLSGIEHEMIYPEDSWRSLMDLQWDSGYLEDIVFELEKELGVEHPTTYPTDDRLPFAEYVRELAICLNVTKGCDS